jgi:hypothetical protein
VRRAAPTTDVFEGNRQTLLLLLLLLLLLVVTFSSPEQRASEAQPLVFGPGSSLRGNLKGLV